MTGKTTQVELTDILDVPTGVLTQPWTIGDSIELARGFITRDSGKRQEFPTGSRRDSAEGKGRFDLIPPYPLTRLAQLYERGAAKYGDRNWEKGQPVMRYMDSLLRHATNFLEGEDTEDHLAAIVFNAFGAIFTLRQIELGKLPVELDDRLPK